MTKHISSEESTISRQTRNAFLTAIAFTIAAIVNFFVSLQVSITTKNIFSIIDTFAIFAFVILLISSARLIRKGQREKGVWLLLGSFVVFLAIRNAVIVDMSIVLGILAISLVPLIGLVTLKPSEFNRSLTLGIFAGSFYLIFDITLSNFLAPYRLSSESAEAIIQVTSISALIFTIAFFVVLFLQLRYLLLSSKLTLAVVFVTLIPIIALSAAGAASLENTLGTRQTEAMEAKATLVAQSIDNFISANIRSIRVEAQSPAIIQYLSEYDIYGKGGVNEKTQEQALESLRTFRQKDILITESYAILDKSGNNVLDTWPENVDRDEQEASYFTEAFEKNLPFVSDVIRPRASDEYALYFSAPIILKNGEVAGILRAQLDPDVLLEYLNDYLRTENVDEKEIFVALVTEEEVKQIAPEDPSSVYIMLVNGRNPELNHMSATPLNGNVITQLQMSRTLPVGHTATLSLDVPGLDEGLRNRASAPVFEAQAFPRNLEREYALDIIATAEIQEENLPWSIVLSQDLLSFNAPLEQQNNINTILAIVIAVGGIFGAYAASQYLTKPFLHLATVANQVAEGDLSVQAKIDTYDEIGSLGNAFNSMTNQLTTLVTTLEERVAERTQAVERNEEQLLAAVEVGKTAAALRDLDELLTQATELISQQFGFYHAGIFLIDAYGKYALLKAANSEGGHRMLLREHKLEVGAEGIVGYVTAKGEARIALDVGKDATFFNNPALPLTRSEMALPLIAGGKILGALDIQSTKGEAFSQSDIASLQVLADQIAVAIENARLFEENKKALAAVQRAYGEQGQLGWKELSHKNKNYGFIGSSDGSIYPLQEDIEEDAEKEKSLGEDKLSANIPIMVRGESVGSIRLAKPENARAWDQKDLDLAETLTTEISRAMDSARLFDETRQQADRERVVGEISSRMRETMNVESVVRIAADELYKLLDLEHITIHLGSEGNQEEEEIV